MKAKMIKIKPSKKGLKVFNPATRLHIKDEGEEVVDSIYFKRLVNSGDVVIISEEPKKKKINKPKEE